jgi:nicotinate-nucleotide pyrophosphorylase (carboxylating)
MARSEGTTSAPEPDWLGPSVHRLIDLALDEDLGRGDVTTDATVPAGLAAEGAVVAREPVVAAGLAVAAEVWRRLDAQVEVTAACRDGDAVARGGRLLDVRGSARALLRGERTALNFLQRLSGIATLTRAFVDAVAGTRARIADTRKTYPGGRALEKLAVRAGGGSNHRFDLGSGVLIKDNHLAVAGSLSLAVARARAAAPHGLKIEVEVDTLAQLDEALAARADIVLLDNFTLGDVTQAVARVAAASTRPLLEVSGGVTLATVRALADTGVDIVSVGALTHSARAVDLSLDLRLGRSPSHG